MTGFNNSVIQLWQMNQHANRGHNLYKRFSSSHCRWELNNFVAEHEDAMDVDIKAQHTTQDIELEYIKEKYFEKKYEDNS